MPDTSHLPGPPPRVSPADHAFFLDLDGTLAPIVEDPAEARLPARTRALLERLVTETGGAVAVISGRGLTDLDRIIAPLRLPASGSHGVELRLGNRSDATENGPSLPQRVIDRVEAFAVAQRVTSERKPGAIALHYRKTPDQAESCRAFVDEVTRNSDELRALHGKMVSEVALQGIDKGHALKRIADSPAFKRRRPVMVGDDVTDEDGFGAAQALGGFGIKIGEGPTAADHRLADVTAFADWLEDILS